MPKPKKVRRVRSRPSAMPAGVRPPATTHAQVVEPATRVETTPSATTGSGKRVDFSSEYHYIIADLRKMAIIAASMFVVLIVLSFIIR